jgi:Uma2 family endonuclease
MATVSTGSVLPESEIDYPTGDGQPMAETPVHRDNLAETIATLRRWYAGRDDVYISGNMFVYYARGNRRKHVAPDVFLVHGVSSRYRDCYKIWEEAKPDLDLTIEFTSRSTREEDLENKFDLYRKELRVSEYLLFDPCAEYLEPAQRLFRLTNGIYQPVDPVDGRLPSEVLGLHFDRDGSQLRLWNPATKLWLPTTQEIEGQLSKSQAENEQLRRELEELRQNIKR